MGAPLRAPFPFPQRFPQTATGAGSQKPSFLLRTLQESGRHPLGLQVSNSAHRDQLCLARAISALPGTGFSTRSTVFRGTDKVDADFSTTTTVRPGEDHPFRIVGSAALMLKIPDVLGTRSFVDCYHHLNRRPASRLAVQSCR